MTDTLFKAVTALGRILGGMAYGTATGGTTTTLIDTTRVEPDDYWNRGTALIVTDAAGASAAPEGEWGVISDWANTSKTATISTLTAAPATGDTYAMIPPRWSLEMLINKINAVLTTIKIAQVDTTTLDTVDNQTEYNLPAACTGYNLRRVFIETNDDSNDNKWAEVRNWTVIIQATGTQDVLVIPQYSSGYDIRLDYVTTHPVIYTPSTKIHESIHLNRIIYHAAVLCLAEEMAFDKSYKGINPLANYFQDMAARMELEHPVYTPEISNGIKEYRADDMFHYTGEVGSVRL